MLVQMTRMRREPRLVAIADSTRSRLLLSRQAKNNNRDAVHYGHRSMAAKWARHKAGLDRGAWRGQTEAGLGASYPNIPAGRMSATQRVLSRSASVMLDDDDDDAAAAALKATAVGVLGCGTHTPHAHTHRCTHTDAQRMDGWVVDGRCYPRGYPHCQEAIPVWSSRLTFFTLLTMYVQIDIPSIVVRTEWATSATLAGQEGGRKVEETIRPLAQWTRTHKSSSTAPTRSWRGISTAKTGWEDTWSVPGCPGASERNI